MKRYTHISLILIALASLVSGGPAMALTTDTNCANPDPTKNPYEGTWICPDEAAIPNTPEGNMIRYGKELLTKTYKYMTQLGVVPAYSIGNQLSCTNCHVDEGRGAYSGSWAVIYYKYGGGDAHVAPNQGSYSSRINQYLTVSGRIQDCLQRSMNAQTNLLDNNSYEMQSMVSYMKWLSTGVQWWDMGGPVTDWKQVKGQSFIPVSGLTRPTDPVRGKTVYEENCAVCHGSDGEGIWDSANQVYIYPAVWGPRSFNDGAGMYRLRTAVGFIKGIMPYGWANATDATHQLTAADAWDAMTYVVYNNRPQWWNRLNDWNCIPVNGVTCINSVNGVSYGPDGVPDWMRKLVDTGYPNYYPRLNGMQYTCNTAYPQVFTEAKHLYGPWSDMITLQSKIISDFNAGLQPACP